MNRQKTYAVADDADLMRLLGDAAARISDDNLKKYVVQEVKEIASPPRVDLP
jgi:hypothetical protein